MTGYRRFTLSLAAACALVFWLDAPTGLARAQQGGVHLTPNGYRVQVHGMSRVKAKGGTFSNECLPLSNTQTEAYRFGRSVSRTMARRSSHAIVQASGDPGKATFRIIYTDAPGVGFNDPREGAAGKRALEAALAAWSQVLQGTIPIVIQARMEAPEDPESRLLAAALVAEFATLVDNDLNIVLYPTALASQLLGENARDLGEADVEIVFNPDVNWDYSLNGAAPPDKISFVYVAMHEIAHGLGFTSSFDSETGTLRNTIPFVYDVFVNRGSGRVNLLTDRGAGEIVRDLVSRDLYFAGENAVEASERSIHPLPMVRLYAPDPYEPGSSIAHVDQDTYADLKTGLMTPRDFGTGTDKIDILTLGILADMGYELVPGAITARVKKAARLRK